MEAVARAASQVQREKSLVVDVDVHPVLPSWADILPYLEDPWREYITDYGWLPEKRHNFPERRAPRRWDAHEMARYLFEDLAIEHVVLSGLTGISSDHSWYEFAAARARAYNQWLVEEWLERDSRYLGSIHVGSEPEEARREIDRMAGHPRMVQIVLEISDFAWGEPYYHPIFEAASRHGLVVYMHTGESVVAAAGDRMRYYWSWRASAHPQSVMTQVISLITNGVFEKYEGLKVVFAGGGYEWLPFLMWRMDAAWKALRNETPWVKRLPSAYIKEHTRFVVEPWQASDGIRLMQVVELVDSDSLFIYGSDFPYTGPGEVEAQVDPSGLLKGIPESTREKILYMNAREFYGL